MKKLLSLIICLVFIFALTMPINATISSPAISSEQILLDNGIVVLTELFEISSLRSTSKSYTLRRTFTRNDETIAIIAITANFSYDGSTVSVISKSVSQSDTYNGWSFKQNSFTSSAGTVTLEGKLTKLLILNSSFTMTLTCDKNGNISYS